MIKKWHPTLKFKFKYLLQLYFVIWFIKFSPSRDEITLKKIKIKILMLLVVVDISTCFIAMINENASLANLPSSSNCIYHFRACQ